MTRWSLGRHCVCVGRRSVRSTARGQLTGTGDAGLDNLGRDARPFFYDPAEQSSANLGDLGGDFADPADVLRHDASKGLGLNDAGWVVGVSSSSATPGVVDDRPLCVDRRRSEPCTQRGGDA